MERSVLKMIVWFLGILGIATRRYQIYMPLSRLVSADESVLCLPQMLVVSCRVLGLPWCRCSYSYSCLPRGCKRQKRTVPHCAFFRCGLVISFRVSRAHSCRCLWGYLAYSRAASAEGGMLKILYVSVIPCRLSWLHLYRWKWSI